MTNDTLTAVPGFRAGHWTDLDAATGCTVVLCPSEGAVCGVDVRGGAPGTRETDLLNPTALVDRVHAVVLSGGSAFGLAAADGVMRWLAHQGVGFDTGVARVPIVPGAVIFDLAVGRADVWPDAAAGRRAAAAASPDPVVRGCVGAGTGAAVGFLGGPSTATKSGLGSAVARVRGGPALGAVVAANAFGDVVDPESGTVLAGLRAPDGGFAGTVAEMRSGTAPGFAGGGAHTVVAVVGTDAELTKSQATRVAMAAHDGLARTVRPAHTMLDGDTVFALATGSLEKPADLSLVCALAADVLAAAIVDAVRSATSLAGLAAARDVAPG